MEHTKINKSLFFIKWTPQGDRDLFLLLEQLLFSRATDFLESREMFSHATTSISESLALTMAHLLLEFTIWQHILKHTKATSGLFLFSWPSLLVVQMYVAIFILFGLVEL